MSYRHSIIKTQRHSNNFIWNPFNYLYAWILTVTSTSSIPRKSTLLKSSGVCILCRTNTRRACMASDGSGLLARRVLKHCPVLALVLVADPRSDRSQIQCPFRKTFGTAHTTSRTLVWLPSWAQPCQQSAHIPITPKEFNSFHYH